MTTDYRIDIAANGAGLSLSLFAKVPGIPDAGRHFDRQPLNLASATVDKLRRGEASHLEVQQITAEISQWLFSNDISPYLETGLNQPGDEQVRLILSIEGNELRQSLSDAPFELCVLSGGQIPLALNRRNAAILHLLPNVGSSPLSPGVGSWPLRILIVRSNPIDLGGAIPEAGTVRDDIYEILDNNGLDSSLVQVHILSREAGADIVGQPTRAGFRGQIRNRVPYDILVYLGHGDVLPVYQEEPPVCVLQLESDDGATHVSIPADKLAVLLHEKPVPVVLLIGCLTAAGVPADQKAGLDSFIPQWMRGVQGLAQALVNSESRVQVAVGTRYMLETVDAMLFLKTFFNSLLQTTPGNVEAAVHAARGDLHFGNPGSYSWSAPMIFRNLGGEPVFKFLESPPASVCPTSDQHQSLRSIFWDSLSKIAWGLRQQSNASVTMLDTLNSVEEQYKQHILQTAPSLIMPKCVEAHSDNSVTFSVELYGALNIDELRGTLVVGGSNVKLTELKATPELLASGYEVLSGTQGNQATFIIERTAAAGAMQAGPVLMATVQLDSATQVVYPTNVNIRRTTPQQAVCTGTNALIVPAP